MINFESQNKIRLGMARRMAHGGMVVNDAQKLRNERNARQREDEQAIEMGKRMAEMDMANAMAEKPRDLGFDPKFDMLPETNLTPAQQIYAQSMDRKYPNVDRDNPLVKAVLDKNPMLANYIDTQYQKLNEDYGSQASIEKAENLVRMDDFEKENLQRLYDEKAMEVSPAMAEIKELDTPFSMADTEIDQENPLPGDIVDAKLEPGEYVLNKNIVKAIGKKALDTLNKEVMPRFARGKAKTKKELKKSAQIARTAFAKASAKAKDKIMNLQEGGSIGTPNVDKRMRQKLKKIQQDKKLRELLKKRVPKESYKSHIKMREASGDLMTKEETEKVLQYFMQKNKAKQNYQKGGKVFSKNFYNVGADYDDAKLDMYTDDMGDDMYTMKRVLSVPAEQVGEGSGLRYYTGEAKSDRMGSLKPQTYLDATYKMTVSPQDSIPKAMIKEYLAPERKNLRKLLGFQEGGMVSSNSTGGEMKGAPMSSRRKMNTDKKFKPHMMYHPKTKKGVMANKMSDHLRLKKLGYTHSK